MFHTTYDSYSGDTDHAAPDLPYEPDAFFRRLTAKYQALATARPRSGIRIRTTDLYTAEHMREERLWRKDAIARHVNAAD